MRCSIFPLSRARCLCAPWPARLFLALYYFSRAKDAALRLNMLNLLASLIAGVGVSVVLAMLPQGFAHGVAGLNMVVFAAVAVTPSWRQTLNGGLVVLGVANALLALTSQGWFSFGQLNIYLVPSLALATLLSYLLQARHLRAYALEAELERRATTDVLPAWPIAGTLRRLQNAKSTARGATATGFRC